jgi:hypothetical protein
LIQAARQGAGDAAGLLAILDADLAHDGSTLVSARQDAVEEIALGIVRPRCLRWTLGISLSPRWMLAEPGEELAFASRDESQAAAAHDLGLMRV